LPCRERRLEEGADSELDAVSLITSRGTAQKGERPWLWAEDSGKQG
jgi:hypothetical protein